MANEDGTVLGQINRLSAEEHELWQRESRGQASAEERARLRELEVELDRCWDLLRQRRARRGAGLDPDASAVRPEDTVERYIQ